MAVGLPVIASDIGGIPEIIEDGHTGFLVPPGDHSALAGRLLHLISEPAARRGMSSTARAEALDRYSTEVVLPEYLDLYRALVHPGRRHRGPVAARKSRPLPTV
jgi:L-malate glycosyltransferase